ncbi:ABC transporter substrate-binding protein [Bacillus salitolerans]|uniref:ABC transporter substrate-binding protein n=1 Tax=Bacillus salitolerans TaxID=1437434 RepID=A0ABW4LVK5_9BACI
MKKMMLAIFFIAIVGIFGACSNSEETASTSETETKNSNTSNTETKAEEKKEPVAIDFWYSLGGAGGELIESMVKDFNSSQDEVVVTPTYQGDYYENHAKVLAAIASNTQPDVTMVEIASIGAFANPGAIEDLGPFVEGEDGVDVNDYIPGLMGNSYWKDTLYAVPFNRSTPLLYVNKNMLEEAGLDPAGPKTWDELEEYSRKLTIKDERWGFSAPIDIWFYEALTFENGGQILNEDGTKPLFHSPEGVEPVEFWKKMIDEGIMKMPPGEKYNAWDVAAQDFTNGKVGMIFTSTGSLNGLMAQAQGFEVGTAFLPAKKDFGVPTGGANLVMLSKSSDEEKKAAWKFMKWMTAKEQTIQFSMGTGYMPVTVSAVESDEMKELYEKTPQFKVAIDQLQYAKPRPMVPGYKELQEVIMTEIQRAIIDGSVTPEEALNTAAEKADKLLKK